MKRILLLVLVLVGGFAYVTSRHQWDFNRLLNPVRNASRVWSDPDKAHTAGLSSDEVNNIDIYKSARLATVNITSTVFKRTWFFEVVPSKDIGSGFIVNEDGTILTNNHVLQGSNKIQVTLQNHDIYEAKVLVRDPQNDLGLIKITPKKKL